MSGIDVEMTHPLIPTESIERKIFIIRGHKVMLDKDLAKLYGVTTSNLNLAVKRNIYRFLSDFMFQLSKNEFKNLILQFETSRWGVHVNCQTPLLNKG